MHAELVKGRGKKNKKISIKSIQLIRHCQLQAALKGKTTHYTNTTDLTDTPEALCRKTPLQVSYSAPPQFLKIEAVTAHTLTWQRGQEKCCVVLHNYLTSKLEKAARLLGRVE